MQHKLSILAMLLQRLMVDSVNREGGHLRVVELGEECARGHTSDRPELIDEVRLIVVPSGGCDASPAGAMVLARGT
jgi:hypothetical protein